MKSHQKKQSKQWESHRKRFLGALSMTMFTLNIRTLVLTVHVLELYYILVCLKLAGVANSLCPDKDPHSGSHYENTPIQIY